MSVASLPFLALILLLVGIALSSLRLFLGPTAADRLVAADTLAVITTAGLIMFAGYTGNPIYLDIALVYAAVAFVGTVVIARAMESNRS
jgi:multisubunit Na+/H+ antiporter MnhF subunit